MALRNPRASFLGLPPELRQEIYQHLFNESLIVIQVTTVDGSIDPPDATNLDLRIMQTNRRIYQESVDIFYGHRRFCISIWEGARERGFRNTLRQIGKDNLKRISDLEVLWLQEIDAQPPAWSDVALALADSLCDGNNGMRSGLRTLALITDFTATWPTDQPRDLINIANISEYPAHFIRGTFAVAGLMAALPHLREGTFDDVQII